MNSKRILCTLLSAVLAFMTLTSCGGNKKNDEKTTEAKATAISSEKTSSVTTEKESTSSTLSPSEISSRSEASSKAAIEKAKSDATKAASSKASQTAATAKKTTTATKKRTTTTTKKKTTKAPSKGKYEVTPNEIKHYIGTVKKAWIAGYKDLPGLYVQIGRIELDKTVSQRFDSSINSQIVNPKTISYKPTCSVAVIVCDDPTQLKVSKGTTLSNTETIAKNVGASIAVNGRGSYSSENAATVRNGELYKPYTGTEGKAKMRFVMYRDGTWKFIENFDNTTAKAEIAKGAYTSTSFQDITIQNGKPVYSFDDSTYRNRTFFGQINANKYVFMTTEFMPIKDAAAVLQAYGVQNAIQINGGNCSQMYVKGIGNTTGSTGGQITPLNKVGYLETEWFAKNGLLAPKKGGGPCAHEMDVFYFK